MASDTDELTQQIEKALADGLEPAYLNAISRAQSLLVGVREGRVPEALRNDPSVRAAYPDELEDAVRQWGDLCAEPLATLRDFTEQCAFHKTDVDPDSQANFCLRVLQAEDGLLRELHKRFRA